ncbi:uncharacterized protein N7446_003991 [Penicillium canescens]|uniref:Uncharacterized protein n=1 Tax=Penicillium canescens TaxID=5083 RepID=A0AAD6N3R5_PENCN|nr:uncharacterized protein N7446_003991 [Penicillium canescens]KAJ6027415.1 hypothetical protein N7460_012232 [Penicillium canescens]KAJ6040694.1 hypothetical protein N7444_009599 [Penicillium canescens]KAJ6066954.1 hypothetical protein N7446_003991 [Penicillium canescens]
MARSITSSLKGSFGRGAMRKREPCGRGNHAEEGTMRKKGHAEEGHAEEGHAAMWGDFQFPAL